MIRYVTPISGYPVLTIIRTIIRLNTGHRLPQKLENWTFHTGFSVVRTDAQVYGHVITKMSWMDRLQNYFRYGDTFDTNLRGAFVMLPNLFWMTGHEGDKSTSKPREPVELISERQLQR